MVYRLWTIGAIRQAFPTSAHLHIRTFGLNTSLFPIFAPMSKSVTPYQDPNATKKEQVATMFNNISKTYDFLNHFMSAGIDVIWRKIAINQLKADKPKYILDVA